MSILSFITHKTQAYSQNDNLENLFNTFKQLPTSLQVNEIIFKAKNNLPLCENNIELLFEIQLNDEMIIPIGKYKRGKSITLIYMVVDRPLNDSNSHNIQLKSKSLHYKTGELLGSNSHLLDITNIDSKNIMTGSFKIIGDTIIKFTQKTILNQNTTTTIAVYNLNKLLTFETYIK